ncbi:MAG: hypothetical protein K2M48_02920 [Clostridiales bacterium]|nr:hypothetical protein [Clostridiales bacterium]
MTQAELDQLKARVEADDPDALFAHARYLAPTDAKESDKFYELAAQLGHPQAAEYIGDKFLADGDYENALLSFKTGAKAGLLDCSVKIAAMNISVDERSALRELEDLAEIGVRSACIALSEYYKAQGNRKQSSYWRSLLK